MYLTHNRKRFRASYNRAGWQANMVSMKFRIPWRNAHKPHPSPCSPLKYIINPLSAKLSFQVWYLGGQRLKVISFSWSGVKSPSKCFSNAESTTIIASRDEKRCYAAVQWARSVHSSSLRFGDQHRKCHGWLLLFALPRAAAWPTCSCASTYKKTVKCKTVVTLGLRNRLLKLADFVNDEGLGLILRAITLWLHCVFSLLDHESPQATRTDRDDDRRSFCARSRQRPEV